MDAMNSSRPRKRSRMLALHERGAVHAPTAAVDCTPVVQSPSSQRPTAPTEPQMSPSRPSEVRLPASGRPPSSFLTLPSVLQQQILAQAGNSARGASCACRELHRSFLKVLGSTDLFARYCLASAGPKRAVRLALRCCSHLLPHVEPCLREQRLRGFLRAVVDAGGDVLAHVPIHISEAIASGFAGLLEELLQLLDSSSRDPDRRMTGGLRHHVASCCWALANCQHMTRSMVRLLVRAVTVQAGVPIDCSVFSRGLREAYSAGDQDALAGLLEAGPPLQCVEHALLFAAKTPHWRKVERLLQAGATPTYWVLFNAFNAGHPRVIRTMARALLRAGSWEPQQANSGLWQLLWASHETYEEARAVARRGTAACLLVEEFGADPVADGGAAIAGSSLLQGGFRGIVPLMLALGADADLGLQRLSAAPGFLEEHGGSWRRVKEPEGVGLLLGWGAETGRGAAAALRSALRDGHWAQARVLLKEGAVSAADCATVLAAADVTERVTDEAGEGGEEEGGQAGAAVVQGDVMDAGEGLVGGEGGVGHAARNAEAPRLRGGSGSGERSSSEVEGEADPMHIDGGDGAEQPAPGQQVGGGAAAPAAAPASLDLADPRRLLWAWELARMGALPRRADVPDSSSYSTSGGGVSGCKTCGRRPESACDGMPAQEAARGGASAPGISLGRPSGSGRPSPLDPVGPECRAGRRWCVEEALEEACKRGDVATVRELLCFGVASEEACTAALRLAVEAGQQGCVDVLRALGAVPPEMGRQAAQQLACRAPGSRQGAQRWDVGEVRDTVRAGRG